MEEHNEPLYALADTQEVDDYIAELGEASIHVQSYGENAFLYIQDEDFSGERQRIVLAHYTNGGIESPEKLNAEALDDILMGAGQIELDGSVLEQRQKLV